MRGRWQWSALVAATMTAGMVAGCAQDIGDIDRTQPNKVLKDDLVKGVWWMNQKVVDSASTDTVYDGISGPSEGSMAETDKVRFVVEENYLIAYRTYPILPGSDDSTLNVNGSDNYEEYYGIDYKGGIRAMFPIESHFDVQREYDSSTGEQSNVITENTSDRPWYERAYMRVKWDQNPIIDPWWYYGDGIEMDLGYNGSENNDIPEKQPYFERDSNGLLVYFDAPATYIVKPSIYDLIYQLMGYGFADPYAALEARIVTSFARDLTGVTSDGDTIHNGNYEPLPYDNYDMNRFGYFRIERDTYDNTTGVMNEGRIQLANRHDIWENNYTVDVAGNKVALPIEMRTVKTTPFYIHGMANEPLLANMSVQMIDEWNVAFKRAVYVMQHPTDTVIKQVAVPEVDALGNAVNTTNLSLRDIDLVTEIDYPVLKAALASEKDVFVACHVPVRDSDPDVCLPSYLAKQGVQKDGYTPREGDFRKNYLWLVNQNLENGLLGYGPTADDPLTSQSISSQAHVYTAYMNLMANGIIDHIKFINGDLTGEGIRANDANIARAQLSRDRFIEISRLPDKLQNAKFDAGRLKADKRLFKLERSQKIAKLQPYNYTVADAKLKALTATGKMATSLDNAVENRILNQTNTQSLSQLKGLSTDLIGGLLSTKNRAYMREVRKLMSAKGYCFASTQDSLANDSEMEFWAAKYKGRNDYDNIRNELRAEILRATALHEMGHTFGLRHNFAGSFDTLNFFDNFWTQREKTDVFKRGAKVENLSDLYSIWNLSKEQIEGGINNAMYSSIMDYYSNDKHGLGRYDHAAILYAYSAGTSLLRDANRNEVPVDSCVAMGGTVSRFVDPSTNAEVSKCVKFQKGLVEYFAQADGTATTRSQMGELPYDVLTHKDTTGISTFDDVLSVSQPYAELVHYRDLYAGRGANFDFQKNRAVTRLENYLAQKKNADGDRMVRVPYIFCTDDNHGKLHSCNTFDSGADMFEQVLYYVNSYQNNYWFTNFARGRAYWDGFNASFGRSLNSFMRLSDLFQHWYVSDRSLLDDVLGDDIDLNYQIGQISVDSIMNFLASVVATPDYGIFCKRKDANALYGLSTDDEARSEVSEFQSIGNCGSNPDYFYVPQGQGRNRYYRYDVNAGFDYSKFEYEAPHLYTSIAAIIALFDNEADVIVNTGDMNTYTFGLYNYYKSDLTKLIDAAYAEDYTVHSPVLKRTDQTTTFNGDVYKTGNLSYPALVQTTFYLGDSRVGFNALTGETVNAFHNMTATVPNFGKCSSSSECLMAENASDVYCTQLYDAQTDARCISLFDTELNSECPAGTTMADVGGLFACVLTGSGDVNTLLENIATTPCSATNKLGACQTGYHCANVNDSYQCVENAMRVETETSLSQKLYMVFYGMLMTGMYGTDSTFYDQFQVYRVGSGEEVNPPSGFKRVTFEDPLTGAVYGANERDCTPDATGNTSIWCRADNKVVDANVSAMLIHHGNEVKAKVEKKYTELLDMEISDNDEKNNTEAYQKYMETLYEWYLAKYELDDIIYDINFVRSAYAVLATIF